MKVNLVPHLCWAIAILLAIIAFLVLHVTNGNEVNSYISFASSIASLILAVVAIFYSMVSNNSLSSSLSSIQGLGSIFERHTERLNQASETLTQKIDEFTPHFSAIPSRLEAIDERIQASLQTSLLAEAPTEAKHKESSFDSTGSLFFIRKTTLGVQVAAYIVAMAAKHNKSVNLGELLKRRDSVKNYVSGAIAVLDATGYKGLHLSLVNNSFYVEDPGSLDIDAAISRGESKTDSVWIFVKKQIKDAFGLSETLREDEAPASDTE